MDFFQLCFIFLFISSVSATCNQWVLSKAAFCANSEGLSSGVCGYGALALDFYGGHVAAAQPSIYRNGEGCGACYQIRCKKSGVCNTRGTEIVVTDIHIAHNNTTDFVLSSRAFRAMALPAKDHQLIQIGIPDVEYKRVPCVYKGQNLTIRVEEFSKPPNYLAVKVLYQGGQTNILAVELSSVDHPTNWLNLRRYYGAVWDTDTYCTPPGKLVFRFLIISGLYTEYFFANELLPANWKPGVTYSSNVQITSVASDGCTPCKKWI